jgi:hypothetical protein
MRAVRIVPGGVMCAVIAAVALLGCGETAAPQSSSRTATGQAAPSKSSEPPPKPNAAHPAPLPAKSARPIAARDDFNADEGTPGLWTRLHVHDGMSLEWTENGYLRLGGTFTEFGSWEPEGLRARPLDVNTFETVLRFQVSSMTGTGTKLVFLEVRWREPPREDEQRLMLYFQNNHEKPGGTYGVFYAGSNMAHKTYWDFGDEDVAYHTLRIVHDGETTRVYADQKQVRAFPNTDHRNERQPLRIQRPSFLIGVQSPADGDGMEVRFDKFVVYGDVGP